MFVLVLVVVSIFFIRLLVILIQKAFSFMHTSINNIRLMSQIKCIPGVNRLALINQVRKLGTAVIIPPKFERDLMIEPEQAIVDEAKQLDIKKELLGAGEEILPALTIMRNAKYLNNYTKRKIEEVIEEM